MSKADTLKWNALGRKLALLQKRIAYARGLLDCHQGLHGIYRVKTKVTPKEPADGNA